MHASTRTGLRRLSRLAALLALVPLLSLALGSCRGRLGSDTRPNVVLISIDCLNERQLAEALAQGYAPNLARLASESVLFTRAHAQAPWTTPSHMSMLTGLYPREHGRDIPWQIMLDTNVYYDRQPQFPTVADSLAAAGYETVAFVGVGSISAEYGLGQGFGAYHEAPRSDAGTDVINSVAACRGWLRARQQRPFFVFFHTYDLHYPRGAKLASMRDAVAHVDRYLGTLLDDLRQAGEGRGSLIFVTGDHGSEMLDVARRCSVHGAGHYEENLRVPLIVHLPGASTPRREDALVRHIDIFPTVADVVGLRRTGYQGEGVSLRRVVAGSARPEYSFSEADARCVQRVALTSQRFKYIYTPGGEQQYLLRASRSFVDGACLAPCQRAQRVEELYDLQKDPGEAQDLLREPLSPETDTALGQLRPTMERYLNLPPRYRTCLALRKKRAARMAPELESGLKALGYIEDDQPSSAPRATPTPTPTPRAKERARR